LLLLNVWQFYSLYPEFLNRSSVLPLTFYSRRISSDFVTGGASYNAEYKQRVISLSNFHRLFFNG